LIDLDNSDFLILAVSWSTSRSVCGKLPVTEFYACLSISSKLQLSSETYVHSVQDSCNCRIPLDIAFRRLCSTSRKTTIRLVMSVSAPHPPLGGPSAWNSSPSAGLVCCLNFYWGLLLNSVCHIQV